MLIIIMNSVITEKNYIITCYMKTIKMSFNIPTPIINPPKPPIRRDNQN